MQNFNNLKNKNNMKKYLAYYENEWPANIAELTAVENKPFVGYLKGEGV
jgi:hypothetical protein